MNLGGDILKLYCREKLKANFYNFVLAKGGRLQTPMLQIKRNLQVKGLWKPDMTCLEMFGMFGLWNTVYYAGDVGHIDFFEIDEAVIKYARKVLKGYEVEFYQADSIRYLTETSKSYDLIYSDIPYGLTEYRGKYGIPNFLSTALLHLRGGGIFITNMDSAEMSRFREIEEYVNHVSHDRVKDMFFVVPGGLIDMKITSTILCGVLNQKKGIKDTENTAGDLRNLRRTGA